ncbi:hypothetical protein TNCV_3511931 [Trichonephila clavipes]|nr:hypothetical protein TNCV_3511931 [Trichonephila clavipes]
MRVSKSVLRLKKAAEGGNNLRKHAGCRGMNTASLEDLYLASILKKNRYFPPGQISVNLVTATGTHVYQEPSHSD